MLASVVPARHVRQRCRHQSLGCRIVTQSLEAPGPRQAQPVEVALLRVGMIGNSRRLGEDAEALRRESLQPAVKLPRLQELGHEKCFRQARRQKIIERRLVADGRIAVVRSTLLDAPGMTTASCEVIFASSISAPYAVINIIQIEAASIADSPFGCLTTA